MIRHIAGVPTTEGQRCVRCCAVIALANLRGGPGIAFRRGSEVVGVEGGTGFVVQLSEYFADDCTPVEQCEPGTISLREERCR